MTDARFKAGHIIERGHAPAHLGEADFGDNDDMRLNAWADPTVAHPQSRDRHFHYHRLRIPDCTRQRDGGTCAGVVVPAARHYRHVVCQNAVQHLFGRGFAYRTGDRHQLAVQPPPGFFCKPKQGLIAVAHHQLRKVRRQTINLALDDGPAVARGVAGKRKMSVIPACVNTGVAGALTPGVGIDGDKQTGMARLRLIMKKDNVSGAPACIRAIVPDATG